MINHHLRTFSEGPKISIKSFGGVSKDEALDILFGRDRESTTFETPEEKTLLKIGMQELARVGQFKIAFLTDILGPFFKERLREAHIKAGIPDKDSVVIDLNNLNRAAGGKMIISEDAPLAWEAPLERRAS